MSTTFSALDAYLHEFWDPDREFVDGEIVERNSGRERSRRVAGRFSRLDEELAAEREHPCLS